jgi:hypothetical protein
MVRRFHRELDTNIKKILKKYKKLLLLKKQAEHTGFEGVNSVNNSQDSL